MNHDEHLLGYMLQFLQPQDRFFFAYVSKVFCKAVQNSREKTMIINSENVLYYQYLLANSNSKSYNHLPLQFANFTVLHVPIPFFIAPFAKCIVHVFPLPTVLPLKFPQLQELIACDSQIGVNEVNVQAIMDNAPQLKRYVVNDCRLYHKGIGTKSYNDMKKMLVKYGTRLQVPWYGTSVPVDCNQDKIEQLHIGLDRMSVTVPYELNTMQTCSISQMRDCSNLKNVKIVRIMDFLSSFEARQVPLTMTVLHILHCRTFPDVRKLPELREFVCYTNDMLPAWFGETSIYKAELEAYVTQESTWPSNIQLSFVLQNKTVISKWSAVISIAQSITLENYSLDVIPVELQQSMKHAKRITSWYSGTDVSDPEQEKFCISKTFLKHELQCTNIVHLNLQDCSLTKLPNAIIHMKLLQELDVARNNIQQLSTEFLSGKHNPLLRKIRLERNKLSHVPDLSQFFYLHYVSLHSNPCATSTQFLKNPFQVSPLQVHEQVKHLIGNKACDLCIVPVRAAHVICADLHAIWVRNVNQFPWQVLYMTKVRT